MEVQWSKRATDDLERISAYISKNNPKAAEAVIRKIYEKCSFLQNFPYLGREGRMSGRRELVISSSPYIAVYQVKTDAVEISRIYHAAQDWP